MTFNFKDVRSVSLYPYNRSQVLHFVTNNVFLDEKVTPRQQQQQIKHKNLCRSRKSNSGYLVPTRMRYPCTTKSTESNDCSQTF